jgi:hypothetical protein
MSGPGFIAEELPQACSLCGKIEECRPYGENGAEICYDCGMIDEEKTRARMLAYIFGMGIAGQ